MSLYVVEVTETFTTRYVVEADSSIKAEAVAEAHNIDDAGTDGDLIGCDRHSVAVEEISSTTWHPVLTS